MNKVYEQEVEEGLKIRDLSRSSTQSFLTFCAIGTSTTHSTQRST